MQKNREREIRKVADAFRRTCQVGRYGIINLFKDCENMGYKVLRYPLGQDGDLGFALKKEDDIVIFTNSSSRLSREIFTLAHEVGHAILHLNSNPSFIDNNMTLSDKGKDEIEQEANFFAACLLMPEDSIMKFLDFELGFHAKVMTATDIARIMSEYNVSFDMVLNRLENIRAISNANRLSLDNQRNFLRVGNLLKSAGANASLNVPSNVIDIPYEYIDYIIFNYNHCAIPLETLERALKCYKLSVDDIRDRLVEHPKEDDSDLDELIGGLTD